MATTQKLIEKTKHLQKLCVGTPYNWSSNEVGLVLHLAGVERKPLTKNVDCAFMIVRSYLIGKLHGQMELTAKKMIYEIN